MSEWTSGPHNRKTYAIGTGVDPNDMTVEATEDGFGIFPTKVAAAEAIIQRIDRQTYTLRQSRSKAMALIRRERNKNV